MKQCAIEFCTEKTQLEIDAFSSYAKAQYEIEKERWQTGMDFFNESLTIFQSLNNQTRDPSLSDYCLEFISDIEPLLELCRFNLGQSSRISNPEIKNKLQGVFSFHLSSRKLTELKWRNKIVQVAHEGLRLKLAIVLDLIEDSKNQDNSKELLQNIYDKIIAESHGARQILGTLLKKNESEDLQFIDQFLFLEFCNCNISAFNRSFRDFFNLQSKS